MFDPKDSFKNFVVSLYLFKKQKELENLNKLKNSSYSLVEGKNPVLVKDLIPFIDWKDFQSRVQKEFSSINNRFLESISDGEETGSLMQNKKENLSKEEEETVKMTDETKENNPEELKEFPLYSIARRFRGIDTTTHKYVYGKLIPSLGEGNVSIILGDYARETSSTPRYHEVYPLSLSASTEYLDRDGNEIFEKDILSYIESNNKQENVLGTVEWDYENQGWYIPFARDVSGLYEDIVYNRAIVSEEPKIETDSYGESEDESDNEEDLEESLGEDSDNEILTEKSSRVRGFEFISQSPENAKLPCRQTKHSAGYDFYLSYDVEILPGETKMIPTWVKAYMPENEYLSIFIRSSLGVEKHLCLANGTGIVDSDYYNNKNNEGHIMLAIHNYGTNPVALKQGSRVAQGIFQKYYLVDNDEASEDRVGGFGSTKE